MEKEKVMSGIRPTGFLHLGNYFGAVQNWIKLQDNYESYISVVDWHSLTTHPDTRELRSNVHRLLSELIASGIDPDRSILFLQSDLPEIAELYLYLNMLAYKGELEKTPTFKDKVRMQPQNVNAGLLTYPVLQAADILIHRAKNVPVGKDQAQHLEMARNFAMRFNQRYTEIFPLPQAFNYGNALLKIMSLDGNGKMSKSENHMNTLYLADEDALIRKKILKARTDSGPETPYSQKPDYIENLFTLMKLVSPHEVTGKYENDYNNCTIRYGDFKKQLAEDMVAFIRPVRQKALSIREDTKYLTAIIEQGKAKARQSAASTLTLVRKAIGIDYL